MDGKIRVESERQETEGDIFCKGNGLSHIDKRGAGGANVINQEEMAPAGKVGALQLKNVAGIFFSPQSVEVGLADVVFGATHHLRAHRNGGDETDAACETFALIVASLAKTLTGERNGNNEVNALKESFVQKIESHLLPKPQCQTGLPTIFEQMNGTHEDGVVIVENECIGTSGFPISVGQFPFKKVLRFPFEVSEGQRLETLITESGFAVVQNFVTDGAACGKKGL